MPAHMRTPPMRMSSDMVLRRAAAGPLRWKKGKSSPAMGTPSNIRTGPADFLGGTWGPPFLALLDEAPPLDDKATPSSPPGASGSGVGGRESSAGPSSSPSPSPSSSPPSAVPSPVSPAAALRDCSCAAFIAAICAFFSASAARRSSVFFFCSSLVSFFSTSRSSPTCRPPACIPIPFLIMRSRSSSVISLSNSLRASASNFLASFLPSLGAIFGPVPFRPSWQNSSRERRAQEGRPSSVVGRGEALVTRPG